jgi:hypothetical protein
VYGLLRKYNPKEQQAFSPWEPQISAAILLHTDVSEEQFVLPKACRLRRMFRQNTKQSNTSEEHHVVLAENNSSAFPKVLAFNGCKLTEELHVRLLTLSHCICLYGCFVTSSSLLARGSWLSGDKEVAFVDRFYCGIMCSHYA